MGQSQFAKTIFLNSLKLFSLTFSKNHDYELKMSVDLECGSHVRAIFSLHGNQFKHHFLTPGVRGNCRQVIGNDREHL